MLYVLDKSILIKFFLRRFFNILENKKSKMAQSISGIFPSAVAADKNKIYNEFERLQLKFFGAAETPHLIQTRDLTILSQCMCSLLGDMTTVGDYFGV